MIFASFVYWNFLLIMLRILRRKVQSVKFKNDSYSIKIAFFHSSILPFFSSSYSRIFFSFAHPIITGSKLEIRTTYHGSSMKKFLLVLIFISACSFLSRAQITIKPGVGFHYMDYSRSIINWDRYGGIGYQFGSTLTIGRRIYFEPGVFWQKNFSEFSQIEGLNGPVSLSHQLSLLRIPVLGGYSIIDTKGSSLDFRVFIGAVFNIPIQVDNSISYPDVPIKDDYSSVFWGGSLGFSLAYWWLFVDTSYELGFSKIFKDPEKFGNAKANSFIVNLGVRIRL